MIPSDLPRRPVRLPESMPRRAFSIRQPYAWAVVMGYKDVENRDWRPWNPNLKFRGRVLVHAGLREINDDVDLVLRMVAEMLHLGLSEVRAEYEHSRFLGAIIGSVTIKDCVIASHSHWFNGPYAFTLDNPRHFRPIPCKGQLGFFAPPTDVLEQVPA